MVIYGKGYDGANGEPKYDNVKTPLRQERRKVWVLSKILKTFRKFYFRKKFYIWQINLASFELIALKVTQEK
jgi:hypothetical protein